MPISRNAGNGGSYINSPGEYKVKITQAASGMSKSGKPMLTVTFQTADEKSIRGYFCKPIAFHMKSLEALKLACGLKKDSPADEMIGKDCGIAVELQAPTESGTTFAHIVGYGMASDVTGDFAKSDADDISSIPF